ncbi:GcrA family cell cycle regulator [Agrobacterium sp. CG674]
MKTRWRTLSADVRSAAIIEAHPKTIGTGAAIAAALSRKYAQVITRSSVISFYNRHPDLVASVPLSGRPGREMAKVIADAAKPSATRTPTPKPAPVEPRPKPKRPSALLAANGMAFAAPKIKPAPPPVVAAEPVPSVPAPEPLNLRLYELESHHCRWPLKADRENTLFCANATHDGTSYCHFHKTKSVGTGSRAERGAVPWRLLA